jgi:hypothetical protein
MNPPMHGSGPHGAAQLRVQARAIPTQPIDDHAGPQLGHEARGEMR